MFSAVWAWKWEQRELEQRIYGTSWIFSLHFRQIEACGGSCAHIEARLFRFFRFIGTLIIDERRRKNSKKILSHTKVTRWESLQFNVGSWSFLSVYLYFSPEPKLFNGRASVCVFFRCPWRETLFCFIVLHFQGSSRISIATWSIDEPPFVLSSVALHPKQFSGEKLKACVGKMSIQSDNYSRSRYNEPSNYSATPKITHTATATEKTEKINQTIIFFSNGISDSFSMTVEK